jgi:hypothetical protein
MSATRMEGQGAADRAGRRADIFRIGALGGLLGGGVIWVYEAIVWVGVQHLLPLSGIPANAVGLVFGKPTQAVLGLAAYCVGTAIHFAFAMAWGVLFALIWPSLRRRGVEATLAALFYAVVAWTAMHLAIMVAGDDHPDYADPAVIIGGFMSHFFFTVPMALLVKRLDGSRDSNA